MAAVRILAIDPGSEQSAWLVLDDGRPDDFRIQPNAQVAAELRSGAFAVDYVVIERIESYGMAVGREVFDTVWWSGRFTEAARPLPVEQLARRKVKLELCGDSRAKDANIRAALIDRFGGQARAVGTTKARGPLYGISRDVWSALAIAVTWAETGS